MSKEKGIDKVFLSIVVAMVILGFTVFVSASMGILASNSAKFTSTIFKQIFWGFLIGFLACYLISKIDYRIFIKSRLDY